MSIAKEKRIKTDHAKGLGWDHIALTRREFKGAVKTYETATGEQVAVCFNFNEAFIVEDEQGLFGVDDLVEGIINDKSINIEFTGEIEGAETLAFNTEDNHEVYFNDEKLAELGLDDFSVRESLKTRIEALSALNKTVDAQL